MIIKVKQNQDWEISKKITWKHKFKYEITKINNAKIQQQQKKHHKLMKFRNRGCFQFNKILSKSNIQQHFEEIEPSRAHSFYSNYIPTASHYRFDDQLTETFPYLRYLQENCNVTEKIQYYQEITSLIKQGQENGNVVQKWQQCFQLFLPQINVLKAIELYLQLLKYGTSISDQIYQQFGGSCKKRVFLHRIFQTARYFRPQVKIRKQLTLSIGSNEEVNQISIAKTSKTLFCSICLLYDCGLHKMHEDVATKDFAYISLRNMKSQSQHIVRTIKLCRFHSFLIATQKKQHQAEYFENKQFRDYCSTYCFKKLNKELFKALNLQRTQLISPLIKALIKIGIEMFSFDPCNISKLFGFKKNQVRGVTCQLIFLYLTEQFNLKAKIQRKFFEAQEDMLLAERVLQSSTTQVILHREPKNNKRKKINREYKGEGSLIATCFHNFIGSQSTISCASTECTCYDRGFCLPQCNCSPNCPIMKNGCNCRNGKDQCRNRKCPCYVMKSECEPSRCMNCFQCLQKGIVKRNSCYNDQILRYEHKLIRIGPSKIPGAGLGAFAGQFIQMDSLVAVYNGQIIEHEIDVIRETLSRDLSFYNFGSPNGTIDARYMGNKSRFINHGNAGQDNVRAVIMFSQGRDIVSFYADRDIEKDQELLFDYDGSGDLYKNFHEKYPFINKKKK